MRRAIPVIVRLVALAVLVLLAVNFVDFGGVAAAFERLSLVTFVGCVLLEWAFYAIESWRIRYLSAHRYRYADIWRSRMLTSFFTSFLPGTVVGEVARVFVLDRARPGNKLYLALLLVTNRLAGVLALACMMLIGLGAYQAMSWLVAIPACAALLVLPLAIRIRKVRGAIVVWVRRRHGRARALFGTVFRAMTHFSRPRVWATAILSSLATNFIVVAEFWWLGQNLKVQLGLGLWIVCVSVSTFASVVPLGFGAIGSQDASLVLVARAVGRPLDPMLAVSFAMHLVRITGTLPGVWYLGEWLRDSRRAKQKV